MLCPFKRDFNYHKISTREWFIKRGYSEVVIGKEIKKVQIF